MIYVGDALKEAIIYFFVAGSAKEFGGLLCVNVLWVKLGLNGMKL